MIVSAKIDTSAPPRRRRGPIKPVYRTVPGSDVVSAPAPQLPTFNISKRIAKPLLFDPKLNRGPGFVPLKCDQLNSRPEGVSLFNAPVYEVAASLDVPKTAVVHYGVDDIFADANIQFEEPLDYKAGIRPTIRRLKETTIYEPVAPFTSRPGGINERRKFQKTTYDVGKIQMELLQNIK